MNYDNFSKAKEIDVEIEKLKCIKNSLGAFYDDVSLNITTLNNNNYKIDIKKSIMKKEFEEFVKRMIRKLERQFNNL